MRPIGVRSSPRSTCTEPLPAFATNTLSANGTYATPCAQTGDPVQHLARCQIHDAKAVVAELGNKQPLPLQIDSKVIDAAANLPEGYLRLKYQRWVCRLRSCRGGPDEARGQ